MKSLRLLALALVTFAPATLSAAIQIAGENATVAFSATPWAGQLSATDLINAGQATLAGATVTATNGGFPGSGINDGATQDFAAPGGNTFFQYDTHFPAAATYQLDLASAPNGYTIHSIKSFMGWATVSQLQANQTYTVEVSVVGSSGFRPLAHVSYKPFSGSGGNYESVVTVSDDTSGVLAEHVDAIRFLFADPGNAGTAPQGTLVREIDVAGVPTATAPPPVAVQTTAEFSETDEAYATQVSAADLVNTGQPTLASFRSSVAPQFGAGGQNDGVSGLANTTAAAWYKTSQLPSVLTFNLNTTTYPDGFVVSAIRTFAGWKNGGTQCYANQKYTVEYQPVGSTSWLTLETVDYSPFSTLSNTPASTKVVLDAPSGNLLTGVAALRFNFHIPTRAFGTNNGTVLQEVDVLGYPVNTTPVPTVTITAPSERHIVQRGAANTAALPVSGTYTASPDRIEARAVVMAGANSGTDTGWQTIVTAPSGGSFAGSLANVAAGGWYRLEVRSVTGVTPSTPATRDRVGVGDIYITAGQSNSANHGAPAYTPADDRVCARLAVTGSGWRHGYDPLPVATGGGGSAWSRLGDLLAAADNLPVGFLSVGVGATQVSQWQPGTSNYNNLLKPALQSFPANGFRAVLWHQGESDSIANVTAANHAALLATMIAQTRTDAGWNVPWGIAEASFHPNTVLTQEEPVTAGQRLAAYADPDVFLGASTDFFHLEDAAGGKLADSVHFNAAGLLDHAAQWRDVLRGATAVTPRNGSFEDNRTPAITGLAPLADGAAQVVNTADTDSPSVIGWRILDAAGTGAANGNNGFHNPAAGTYAAAADTINGGVMAQMAGRHVAMLDGGSPGNHFLHPTRALAKPLRIYTLTVALGVRDNSSSFGNARLDILANGQVVATATFTKPALDALRGSDAAGSFTDVSLAYTTTETVAAGRILAVRIAKPGGAGTVLDFDNVRLADAPNQYGAWQIEHWGSTAAAHAGPTDNPDGDLLVNGFEYFLGYDPQAWNLLPQATLVTAAGHRWGRFEIPLDPAVTDSGLGMEYSFDLVTWLPAASSGDGSVVNSRTAATWRLDIDSAAHPKAFYRLTLGGIQPAP